MENIYHFWKMIEIPEVDKFMYITKLQFPSLDFDLSFHKKIENVKTKDPLF